jgi:parallel beta-helix repeat protein
MNLIRRNIGWLIALILVATSAGWVATRINPGQAPWAANKPAISDAIQYVSPNGSDSNDGLSMGTAKLTLTAAENALPGGPGKGIVYVEGGTFNLTATVNNRSNTRILCNDSTIITQANGINLTTFITFAGADSASLENCTVDGNRSGNTDSGAVSLVSLTGSTNATVKGSRIRNSNGVGVYTGTGTTTTVTNNQFTNCYTGCVQGGFTGSTVATNGTFTDNTFTGLGNLIFSFSDGNTISRNKITGYGQASNVTTSGTSVTWVSGTTFTNLSPGMYMCIGGTEYLISTVGSSTSLTLSSSAGTNTNQLAYLGTPDSLNLANSSNNTITANIIKSAEGYGIVLFQSGSGEAVLHNTISSNTVTLTGGDCVALNSTNATPLLEGNAVIGNTISDCGQGGAAKGATVNRHGIECNGTGTHFSIISGNAIYDDQGSPTTLDGFINQTCATDQVIGPNAISGMATANYAGQQIGYVPTFLATKSSAYSLTANDSWINVTGTTTITVPHALTGQRWDVFNSGSNTVTIVCDTGNINGGANVTRSANTGYSVTADGTNCFAH